VTALFVTATGTDIGKTFVTAHLIRHLQRAGRPVEALKPVASGFDPSAAHASDPGRLLSALDLPVTIANLDRVAPWRFAAPLSPDMAAEREGRRIDIEAVVRFCRHALDHRAGTLLIEGVGGIMVPLDERHTVLDWMTALRVPLLVVAGTYLGTISHTLTALDVLSRRDLSVLAVVVSESAISPVSLEQTVDAIARFARPIPVFGLPRLASGVTDHPLFPRLAALIEAASLWPG
jgi:dethiobiotin synthetase